MIPGSNEPRPDTHPTVIRISQLVNDARYNTGEGQGTNREVAHRIINAFADLFAAEFPEMDQRIEYGHPDPFDCECLDTACATHRRLAVTLYGQWIEESAIQARMEVALADKEELRQQQAGMSDVIKAHMEKGLVGKDELLNGFLTVPREAIEFADGINKNEVRFDG